MRHLYLLIPIILFIAISECSACSLKFISPQKGSTVDKSNITVYGTGKANPEAGDYGTVTATLNGVTFFIVSGSFSRRHRGIQHSNEIRTKPPVI